MRLIYEKSKAEVNVGDHATTHRGEVVQVEYITKPSSPASTGRVGVRFISPLTGLPAGPTAEFYPGVICAEWVEREDQQP